MDRQMSRKMTKWVRRGDSDGRGNRWTTKDRARRETGVTQCKVTCLNNVMHWRVTYRSSVQYYTSLMGRDNKGEAHTHSDVFCKGKKQMKGWAANTSHCSNHCSCKFTVSTQYLKNTEHSYYL